MVIALIEARYLLENGSNGSKKKKRETHRDQMYETSKMALEAIVQTTQQKESHGLRHETTALQGKTLPTKHNGKKQPPEEDVS